MTERLCEFTVEFEGDLEPEDQARIEASPLGIDIFSPPDEGESGLASVSAPAASLEEVVRAAIALVEAAGTLTVIEVSSGTGYELKEVARRLGRHRWRPKKLLDDPTFPAPTPLDDPWEPPMWLWSDVAAWTGDNGPREDENVVRRISEELGRT